MYVQGNDAQSKNLQEYQRRRWKWFDFKERCCWRLEELFYSWNERKIWKRSADKAEREWTGVWIWAFSPYHEKQIKFCSCFVRTNRFNNSDLLVDGVGIFQLSASAIIFNAAKIDVTLEASSSFSVWFRSGESGARSLSPSYETFFR